jgi:hypothetical protein
MAWILVVYIMSSPITGYSVPGFVYKVDCEKAGEEIRAHAKASKLPEIRFLCVEQPRGR